MCIFQFRMLQLLFVPVSLHITYGINTIKNIYTTTFTLQANAHHTHHMYTQNKFNFILYTGKSRGKNSLKIAITLFISNLLIFLSFYIYCVIYMYDFYFVVFHCWRRVVVVVVVIVVPVYHVCLYVCLFVCYLCTSTYTSQIQTVNI